MYKLQRHILQCKPIALQSKPNEIQKGYFFLNAASKIYHTSLKLVCGISFHESFTSPGSKKTAAPAISQCSAVWCELKGRTKEQKCRA